MDEELNFELMDLQIDEICELLQEAGADISREQAEQLAALVEAAGGIDEALHALSDLRMQRAA